jgi:transcriptional regulator GlxA family with amidase domain
MPTTRNLAILIFDDVEVLDFCGPFEVFSVANRFTEPPAFNVLTVASASTRITGPPTAPGPTCCSSPVVRAPARRCTTRR